MGKPTLPDKESLKALGLDEKSIMNRNIVSPFKDAFVKQLEIMDQQQFLTRYKWYNLPHGLNGNLMERILYDRGQAMFFYVEALDKFMFLPYTFSGNLDIYGRYTECVPLPWRGTDEAKKPSEIISMEVRQPIYDFQMDSMTWKDFTGKCVICYDRSLGEGQTITPRKKLNKAIIDYEADMLPYMHTALMNATGVTGMRVNSDDEQAQVKVASLGVQNAALNGMKWLALTGRVDFQDLGQTSASNAQEYLLAMQSMDNFRQMGMGLGDGTLFQTRSHMLQTQANMAIGRVDGIYQDGLNMRQDFSNLVNSLFGLGIWCDVSEQATGYDKSLDGLVADENAPVANDTEGGTEDVSTDE